MPVLRVPVEHKFGILSHGQARKLLRESVEAERAKLKAERQAHIASPSRVDWNFVEKFAVADGPTRKKLEIVGAKCLHRIKYKLKNSQATSKSPQKKSLLDTPQDLSDPWYELVFLCQCEGSVQTDALAVLASSLGSAPASSAQIPCLLYIATLGYRWLKSDDVSEEFLRSGEVVLLRIMYLASLRLFCHVLTGALKDLLSTQEGEYFKTDFDGFHMREQLYEKFPISHFYWRIVLHVGEMICHLISGDTVPSWMESSTTSSYALPPFLWHSLDVWKTSKQSNAQLVSSVVNFLKCTPQPCSEQVVEGVLALGIMFSVAQASADVLSLLQVIARGIDDVSQIRSLQKQSVDISDGINFDHLPGEGRENEDDTIFHRGHVNILGQQTDFKDDSYYTVSSSDCSYEKSNHRFSSQTDTSSGDSKSPSVDVVGITLNTSDTSSQLANRSELKEPANEKSSAKIIQKCTHLSAQHEDLMSSIRDLTSSHNMGHRKSVSISLPEQYTDTASQYAVSEAPLEDGTAFLGSVAPSTLFPHSLLSTPNTLQDTVFDDEDAANMCGRFREFPWELCVAYCGNVTSVVLNGVSSKIQVQALEGYAAPGPGPDPCQRFGKKAPSTLDGKKVFGLTQLAQFSEKLTSEQYDGSWRIRYAAIRGLLAVCHLCRSQVVKDGFSDTAWERVIQVHSREKDRKVFEAFKMPPMLREPPELEGQYSLSIFDVLGGHLAHAFLPDPPHLVPLHTGVTVTAVTTGAQVKPQLSQPRSPRKVMMGVDTHQTQRMDVKSKVSTHWDKKPQKPEGLRCSNSKTLNAIAEKHWKEWLKEEQAQDGCSSPRT